MQQVQGLEQLCAREISAVEERGGTYTAEDKKLLGSHNFFLTVKSLVSDFVKNFPDRFHIDEVEPVNLVIEYQIMEYVRELKSKCEWKSLLTASYVPYMTVEELEAQFTERTQRLMNTAAKKYFEWKMKLDEDGTPDAIMQCPDATPDATASREPDHPESQPRREFVTPLGRSLECVSTASPAHSPLWSRREYYYTPPVPTLRRSLPTSDGLASVCP